MPLYLLTINQNMISFTSNISRTSQPHPKEATVILDRARTEFVARTICDLGKTIFAVAFASYFFEKFPLYVRISFITLCATLLISSVWIHPRNNSGEK
jgi:hypothetical protein